MVDYSKALDDQAYHDTIPTDAVGAKWGESERGRRRTRGLGISIGYIGVPSGKEQARAG